MGRSAIRKGDLVQVRSGKWAPTRGKVLAVDHDRNRVLVEGVNFIQRHQRAMGAQRQSGIIEKEAPIHLSNVGLVCTACDKPVRVGKKFLEDGSKTRICRRCGEELG